MKPGIFILLLLGTAAAAVISGFYPVALVDRTPIFYRTWQKTEEASKRFINASIQSSGQKELINFSLPEHQEKLREIRRGALSFLIENEVLRQEGPSILENFEGESKKRVTKLNSGETIANAAKLAYGLSLEDFERLVLLPQARQDVAREALAAQGKNFSDWFLEAKQKKRVRILFMPFEWDGENVR